MPRPSRIALALIVAALFAAVASAATYQSSQYAYSVTPPTDWVQIPNEAIQSLTRMVVQPGGQMPNYDAGFKHRSNPFMNYPYVLVQIIPGRHNIDQIARELPSFSEKPLDTKSLNQTWASQLVPVGNPQATLDREKRRFVVRLAMNVAGIGQIQDISYGFVGKDNVVTIHCYATANDFATQLPVFNAMADSFRFSPGAQYVDSSILGGALSGGARGAVLGGVAGAVIGVIIYLSKKKSAA